MKKKTQSRHIVKHSPGKGGAKPSRHAIPLKKHSDRRDESAPPARHAAHIEGVLMGARSGVGFVTDTARDVDVMIPPPLLNSAMPEASSASAKPKTTSAAPCSTGSLGFFMMMSFTPNPRFAAAMNLPVASSVGLGM